MSEGNNSERTQESGKKEKEEDEEDEDDAYEDDFVCCPLSLSLVFDGSLFLPD